MKSQRFLRDWYHHYNNILGWDQRQMYDGRVPHHQERMRRIKEILDERLQPTDRVLDLGCGNGLYTAWIGERVREAVGVEIDQGSLDRAEPHPHVRYLCCSWDRLPASLGRFDWCLATEVLEHAQNPEQVIADVHTDQWLITVPVQEPVRENPWEYGNYGHLHAFREPDIRRLIRVDHYEQLGIYGVAVGRPHLD